MIFWPDAFVWWRTNVGRKLRIGEMADVMPWSKDASMAKHFWNVHWFDIAGALQIITWGGSFHWCVQFLSGILRFMANWWYIQHRKELEQNGYFTFEVDAYQKISTTPYYYLAVVFLLQQIKHNLFYNPSLAIHHNAQFNCNVAHSKSQPPQSW